MTRDEKTLYVFALRYALPRHTYALSIVLELLIPKLDEFDDWELEGMMQDCDIYYPSADFFGDVCDQPRVDNFKKLLENILKKRGEQTNGI